jgi:hypothetical protein
MSVSEHPRGDGTADNLRAEVERLSGELAKALEEIERLRRALEEALRRGKRQAAPYSTGKRKPDPQRPGRKPGEGVFRNRPAPEAVTLNEPVVEVLAEETRCPACGGSLEFEKSELVTVTDLAERVTPKVTGYRVMVCRCRRCQKVVRGRHPEVAPDPYGATAHRLGPRVKAAAHVLHYQIGVPERKVPTILKELTGIEVTQSGLTQDALKQAEGAIGAAYQKLREGVRRQPAVHTDDTGWRIHGDPAHLMAFDTPQSTVYQIRWQHRNEEVREGIPADYRGVMVTDRGKSYDAEVFDGVQQPKCLDHLKENIQAVLATQQGKALWFGRTLQDLLQQARQLWRAYRNGTAPDFATQGERIEQKITDHLRPRRLSDPDNQRLLDGIGLQHDRGRLMLFLHQPDLVEPTNNRGERALRYLVIARKVSHCSKNPRGAEAQAAFGTVLQTLNKLSPSSMIDALLQVNALLHLAPAPLPAISP